MFYVGKIVIKKKRKRICYDVAATTKDVLSNMIANFIEELDENNLSKIVVKIKVKKY